jgi:hypothetical protein
MFKNKIRTSSTLQILFLSFIFATILAQLPTNYRPTNTLHPPPFTPTLYPNDPRLIKIKIIKKNASPSPSPDPQTPNQRPNPLSLKGNPNSKITHPQINDVYDSWWFILLMTFVGSVIGFIIGFFVKGIIKRRQKRNRILTRMKTSLFDTIDSVRTGSSQASKITMDETWRVSHFNVARADSWNVFGIGTKVNNNNSYSL